MKLRWFSKYIAFLVIALSSSAYAEKFNSTKVTTKLSKLDALMNNTGKYFKKENSTGNLYKIPAITFQATVKRVGSLRFKFNQRRLNTWPGTENGSVAFLRGKVFMKDGTYFTDATFVKTEDGYKGEISFSGKRSFRSTEGAYKLNIEYHTSSKNELSATVTKDELPKDTSCTEPITESRKVSAVTERAITLRDTGGAQFSPGTIEIRLFTERPASFELDDPFLLASINTAESMIQTNLNLNFEIVSSTIEAVNSPAFHNAATSEDRLFAFRDFIQGGGYANSADTFMVFTQKILPSPQVQPPFQVLGMAYLAGICEGARSSFTSGGGGIVMAHELGHILGANHLQSPGTIMNTPLKTENTGMEPATKAEISAVINSQGACLYNAHPRLAPTGTPGVQTPSSSTPTPGPTSTPNAGPTPAVCGGTPVANAPKILNQWECKATRAAYSGDVVGITWVVDSAPAFGPVSYVWYKNGQIMPGADKGFIVFTVTVDNNNDKYYGVVTNSAGSVTSVEITISVKNNPNSDLR
jgi:hypothetical protein